VTKVADDRPLARCGLLRCGIAAAHTRVNVTGRRNELRLRRFEPW
jgi:hypothetical protein